jgi:hypothetical protein
MYAVNDTGGGNDYGARHHDVEDERLAEAVRTNHPRACEALAELERRLPDLRNVHKCGKPLKHIP